MPQKSSKFKVQISCQYWLANFRELFLSKHHFNITGYKLPATKFLMGFTLVEIMLTIGIITILTAAVLPSVGNFADSNIVAQAAQNLASDIENAKFKALSGIYDDSTGTYKNWGFYCTGASASTYLLSSYNGTSRSGAPTQRTAFPAGNSKINCGGGITIVFQRLSGIPILGGGSEIIVTKNTKVLYVRVDSSGNISISKI